jgi:glycosyltransferase involved in cell wall biosynthesis
MKVLHVVPSVAPVRGGPSYAVMAMVKALRSQGIDAEIATTNDSGPDILDVLLQKRTEYEQVPIWFFPRFSPAQVALREFIFSSSLTTWLWQHITNYDLVHVHAIFSYPSTIAMTIARFKGVPYITRTIGQLCNWSLDQSKRKKQMYLALIERANLNYSRGLHFTAQQEAQEVSTVGLVSPSFVLPLGLTLPNPNPHARQILRQMLKVADDEPIILFMSRLHPKKGLDYLIPALGKLASQHRFTFLLAGNGTSEYEAMVSNLLETAGIRDRTYQAGFVMDTTKELFLQGSDLFALTSHSENFGVAVLEALAAGLPALVTPGVALAARIQQDHLGYVTQLESSAIAAQIEQWLLDIEQGRKMGDRARQVIAQRYAWNRIALDLMQVYTAIIQDKPIPVFED